MGKMISVEAVVVKIQKPKVIFERPQGTDKAKQIDLDDYELVHTVPDGWQLPPSTSSFPHDGVGSTTHIKHGNGIYKKKTTSKS